MPVLHCSCKLNSSVLYISFSSVFYSYNTKENVKKSRKKKSVISVLLYCRSLTKIQIMFYINYVYFYTKREKKNIRKFIKYEVILNYIIFHHVLNW